MEVIFTDRYTGGRALRVSRHNFRPSLLPFQGGGDNELFVTDQQGTGRNFNCNIDARNNLVISGAGWNGFSASLRRGDELTMYKDENGNYRISVRG